MWWWWIAGDVLQLRIPSSQQLLNMRNPHFVRYQIISNRLYRSASCTFAARCSGIEHFLLQLLKV